MESGVNAKTLWFGVSTLPHPRGLAHEGKEELTIGAMGSLRI